MMSKFDPTESEFNFSVDPLTADTQGLAILDELEKNKQIKGNYGPEFEAHIEAKQTKLKTNLASYRDYKVKRNEKLFSFAPEARAQTAAIGEGELAQSISDLLKADKATFDSLVEGNGDTAWFKKGQHFMQGDDSFMREKYSTDHILKLAGYSDRVIASGAAEPLMRERVGAKDSEGEPTNGAFLRWGTAKLNDIKRRKHVRDSAIAEVNKRFIGVTGDKSDFAETLEGINATDEERTLILRASNKHREHLEKEYVTIKPRVLKAFNTIGAQEGITSRFEAGAYDNLVEAAKDFSQNIPIQDFPKVVRMFTLVAEAHGEDVDDTMEKVAKSFKRGGSDLFGKSAVGWGDWFIGEFEKNTERRENKTFRGIQDAIAGVLGMEEEMKAIDEGTKEARKEFNNFKAFYGELTNWRESVAKVGSDSWLVDNLVYGTIRSLPEMGAAATGIPGIMLVAAAAKERNMVGIRRDVAPGKWRNHEAPAGVAGMAYSLLNLAQFNTLSAKLPGTNHFITEMGKRVFFEGLQETGQDLSLAFSLEFFSAVDKDVKDLDLGSETMDAVKRFPLTMIAVSPLVLAGGLGQKALEYHDVKKFEKSLQDPDFLALYGIEAEDQLVIRNLSVPDALDYIKDNNGKFLDNINGDFEASIAPPSGEVVFEEGRKAIIGPKVTPEMFTRVERRLLPEEQEVADYERWKAQQGVDTETRETPMETVLEESYGDFLSDQLREAIGADKVDGNKESIARIKAQQAFQERVKQLEKESVDKSIVADNAARQTQKDRDAATIGFSARINASPDGTFSITNGDQTMQAKSPEEAAEAAMALDPRYAEQPEGRDQSKGPTVALKAAQKQLAAAQAVLQLDSSASKSAEIESEKSTDVDKRDKLQVAVDEAQVAVDEAQVAVDEAPARAKRNITDPRINPDFDTSGNTVMHSFPGPLFGTPTVDVNSTNATRAKEGLPPKKPNWGEKKIEEFRKFITMRDIPSKRLQKILDTGNATIGGIQTRFTKISNSYNARLKRHLNGVSKNLQQATRDQILNDSFYSLRGDKDALSRLPPKIKELVESARKDIDLYSQWVIDSGLIKKEVKKAFGNNLGEYIKREFKVFDPEAQWNYDTIRAQHSHIYDAALDDIMNNGKKKISQSEADEIIKEMTHYSRARNFVNGISSVKGIDVSSLIKKNNKLSDPVLELLGEVVDPAANIRGTGGGVSRMLVTYQMQEQMAKTMVAMGIGGKTKTAEFNTQLGQESYTLQKTSKKGKVSNYSPSRTKKSMMGFDGYWFEPEIAAHMENYFTGVKGEPAPIAQVMDLLSRFSASSKFTMVLLNPAAYPTNFLGGVNSEFLNMRMFGRGGIGRKAYLKGDKFLDLKDAPGPYTTVDQVAFYKQSGKEFGDVNKMNRRQLNSELQQLGLLDNSVIGSDLLATLDSTVGAAIFKEGRAVKKNLALGYQAADNAIKRSAFVHELDKWIRAEPDLKMDELVRRAGEDVRQTTQNYDQVPRMLRYFSQRGVFVPTFVSFSWELGRNAKNTALVAYKELRSGNPVLVAAGRRRLVGMGMLSAAMYGITSGISQWAAGLDDDERADLEGQLPFFNRHREMTYLKAGNGIIQSFDPSYIMPHMGYYNMAVGVAKGATAGEKIENLWGAFDQAFLGQNILFETAVELSSNEKARGGKVYNELTDVGWDPFQKQLLHVRRKMFKPGIERLFEKVKAIQKNEVGPYGSQPSESDAWAMMIGARPTTTNYNSPEFMEGQLSQFSFDRRDIRSAISKGKMEKFGKGGDPDPNVNLSPEALTLWQSTKTGKRSDGSELNPKQIKEIEKVVVAEEKQKKEFTRKVVMFNSKKLGISSATILDAMKVNSTPKHLQELFRASIDSKK